VGKVKTALQMVAIGVLLAAGDNVIPYLAYIGYVLLYIAAVLTIWSMIAYLRVAAPELSMQQKQ
jgi:phosphatidylglycerophosphate synthase